MGIKKLSMVTALAIAFAVLLVGCGKQTAKEEFFEAYANVEEAKQYDMTTTISFDADETLPNTIDQEELEMLTKSTLTLDVKGDEKKTEVGIKAAVNMGIMTLDLELPVIIDMETEDVYAPIEAINNIPFFGVELSQEDKGKYINLSSDDVQSLTSEETADMESFEKSVKKLIEKYKDSLSEESFKKNEQGEIILDVDPEIAADFIMDVNKLANENIKEDKGSNMSKSEITDLLKDIKVTSMIEGEEMKTLDVKLVMESDGSTLNLNAKTKINKINGKIDFEHTINKKNVMSFDEFSERYGEEMSLIEF